MITATIQIKGYREVKNVAGCSTDIISRSHVTVSFKNVKEKTYKSTKDRNVGVKLLLVFFQSQLSF